MINERGRIEFLRMSNEQIRGLAHRYHRLSFLGSAASSTVSAVERPNIIVFVTDDQVKQELGCYSEPVLTPDIDRLAREGTGRAWQTGLQQRHGFQR